MLAARMYGYNQPLVLEDIKVPEIASHQVLVRVGAAGMCRSDAQLIDGYFQPALEMKFPITPAHEIADLVEAIGDRVPKPPTFPWTTRSYFAVGWGDGICASVARVMSRFANTEAGRASGRRAGVPSSLPSHIVN